MSPWRLAVALAASCRRCCSWRNLRLYRACRRRRRRSGAGRLGPDPGPQRGGRDRRRRRGRAGEPGVELEVVVLDDHSTDRTADDRRATSPHATRGSGWSPPRRCRRAGAASSTPAPCWPERARHPLLRLPRRRRAPARPTAWPGWPRSWRTSEGRPGQRLPAPGDGHARSRSCSSRSSTSCCSASCRWSAMRRSRHPAYGAGCGQLFLARARGLRAGRRPRGDPGVAARRHQAAPGLPPRRAS